MSQIRGNRKLNNKKVLIISYLWPPAEGIGLMRALKFAKYLPSYGWEPVVLTVGIKNGVVGPEEKDIKVYRTEALNRLARGLIAMPDEQIGWYKNAVEEGKKILSDEPIDLVFSTSPPETAHLVARTLKRYRNLPWVADLRDLWADDHFRKRHPLKRAILRVMEKVILKYADLILTVSDPWARKLAASLGAEGKVKVVENGYDEEDFSGVDYKGNEKLMLVYTGKLHKEHQPIDNFLKALRELIDEKRIDPKKIEVRFYVFGYDKPDVNSLAALHGLDGIVAEFPRVRYHESSRIQRRSDALLFVQWQGRGKDGWYSAKLYDYIGARRPILALAERGGIIEDLISRTASGVIAKGHAELKEAILTLYLEHEGKCGIGYNGNEKEILKNTRSQRAEELAGFFDGLVDG